MNETIFRLRSLHGVYDRALMNASAMIANDRLRILASSSKPPEPVVVFEELLAGAQKELELAGVFHGRWTLFDHEELVMIATASDGHGSSLSAGIRDEVEAELSRRNLARV